jgi:hypothetical protein
MVGFLCLDSNLLIDIDREIQTKIPFLSAQLGRLRVDITEAYDVFLTYCNFIATLHFDRNNGV